MKRSSTALETPPSRDDHEIIDPDFSRGKNGTKIPIFDTKKHKITPHFFYLTRSVISSNAATLPESLAETVVTLDENLCCSCSSTCDKNCSCLNSASSENFVISSQPNLLDLSKIDSDKIFFCSELCFCQNCDLQLHKFLSKNLNFQIFKTKLKNYGLRCSDKILKGQMIAEYVGEIITHAECVARGDDSYFFHFAEGQPLVDRGDLSSVNEKSERGSNDLEMTLRDQKFTAIDAKFFGNHAQE